MSSTRIAEEPKLAHLDAWNESRIAPARIYDSLIGPGASLRVLPERPGSRCVYHLYPIRVADRDALASRLGAAAIATGIHYDPAAHRHRAFDGLLDA